MHDHSHHHHDIASNRIAWAFFLNLGFTFVELIGGLVTNSTAILADAVHDLGDSLAIGSAWLLAKLSGKHPDSRFSYGYQRFSLLGALLNGLILVVGSLWVLSEAIPRLQNPPMPMAEGMLLLSIFGIAVNGFAAYKLSSGKTLNERVLNWHLLEDVLGWVAVLIVSVTLLFVELPILDPLLSIIFTLYILFGVIKTIKQTLKLFLQGSPDNELYQAVKAKIKQLERVKGVHHFHLWSLDGEHHVLSAHLVIDREISMAEQQLLKQNVAEALAEFELMHTTIEIELSGELCRDE